MKKIISAALALTMLFSLILPVTAMASEPYSVENPLYSESPSPLLKSASSSTIENSVSKKYKGKTYNTCGKQMYVTVKNQLQNRKSDFDIYCLSKYKLNSGYQATNNILNRVFYGATEDELSQNCIDGDYVRWAIMNWSTEELEYITKKDGYYYYILTAHYDYYDSPGEERKVDSIVNSFLNSLKTSGKSDVQILRNVHDFICKRTTYDNRAAEDPYGYLYAFSPYGALVKGKSVCQGYAAAFYRICKELGYKVRFVSSNPNIGCHAWNIVELDGKYYIVDCTWDDNAWDDGETTDFNRYSYFLVNYDTSKENDTMMEHSLDSRFYGTGSGYFYDNYYSKFSEKNYFPDNEKRLSNSKVTLSSTSYYYSGKANTPNVSVSDGSRALSQGKDYTVKYSYNTNTGCATVTVNGMGEYSGMSTRRRFTVKPTMAKSLKISSVTDSRAALSWTPSKGNVSGYAVQKYDGRKWITLGYTKAAKYTAGGLKPSEKQKLRVLAYRTVSKRYIYSNESNYVYAYTKPSKASITSLKAYSKSFAAKWKKTSGSGYQLQYGTNKNMSGAKTLNINSAGTTSKTIKKLKKKKVYYVRIRAYKRYTINGKSKTYYGAWSTNKAIKTK